MTDAPELRPCPFCGGTSLHIDALQRFIQCRTCETFGPDAPNVVRAWNTRADLAPTWQDISTCDPEDCKHRTKTMADLSGKPPESDPLTGRLVRTGAAYAPKKDSGGGLESEKIA